MDKDNILFFDTAQLQEGIPGNGSSPENTPPESLTGKHLSY